MLDPIHPFPARMAPEIAFDFLADLPTGAVLLDPMCGSGVSLRSAVEAGCKAIGFDTDPLAVLMSKVWVENSQHKKLSQYAGEILDHARGISGSLPWIRDDKDTRPFMSFWFAPRQRKELSKLALALHKRQDKIPPYILRAMKLALSRLIITKTKGASLAWDVAHSRPHRKKVDNDFDVFGEFEKSCGHLAKKLCNNSPDWSSVVRKGDARRLALPDQSVDAIITSPPYLNAIDYMRGHRLSLVWLGHSLGDLRSVRSGAIGSERCIQRRLSFSHQSKNDPDPRIQGLVDQYIFDLGLLVRELKRVAKPKAKVCVITANSKLRGYEVRTNTLVHAAASGAGLRFVGEKVRLIEQTRRYLPTPSKGALKARMMEEHIQYFAA